MRSDSQSHPVDPTPEATAFEHVQRAIELALQVRDEHPADVGAWKAWEALATARALMYGAYAADDFLYSARATAAVAIQRALRMSFAVALRYHHPDPGRAAWDTCYQALPAVGAWHSAADSFCGAIQAAYYPGFWEDFERLREGDASALETAIQFLEADPWFHRSGYAKEYLIRFVKRCELTDEQAARLRQVVMHAIETRDRREFRRYCRLAARVSSPEFRAELENILSARDASTPLATRTHEQRQVRYDRRFRLHIEWVLAYIDGHPLPDRRTEYRRSRAMARAARRRRERRQKASK
jgi:hypothetical protein